MARKPLKPKKRCCQSRPRCRRCPVRLKRERRAAARAEEFPGLRLVAVPAGAPALEAELKAARRRVKAAKKELKRAKRARKAVEARAQGRRVA